MIIYETNTDKKKNKITKIPALRIQVVFQVLVIFNLFSNQANNLTF